MEKLRKINTAYQNIFERFLPLIALYLLVETYRTHNLDHLILVPIIVSILLAERGLLGLNISVAMFFVACGMIYNSFFILGHHGWGMWFFIVLQVMTLICYILTIIDNVLEWLIKRFEDKL